MKKRKNKHPGRIVFVILSLLILICIFAVVMSFTGRSRHKVSYPKDTWGYLVSNLQERFGSEGIMDEYFDHFTAVGQDGGALSDGAVSDDIYMNKLTVESASYILSRGISTSSSLREVFVPKETVFEKGADLYLYKFLFEGSVPDSWDSYDGQIMSRLKSFCNDISLECAYYENGDIVSVFTFNDISEVDLSGSVCPLSDLYDADEFYREYIAEAFGYGLLDVSFSDKSYSLLCRPKAQLPEEYADRILELLGEYRRPERYDLIPVDVSSQNEFSMASYEEYFRDKYDIPEGSETYVYVKFADLPILYAARYMRDLTDDVSGIFFSRSLGGTEYDICFNTVSRGLVHLPFGFCLDTPVHFFISPGEVKDPVAALRLISGIFPSGKADGFVTLGSIYLKGGGERSFTIAGVSCELYENENGGFDIYIGTVFEEEE